MSILDQSAILGGKFLDPVAAQIKNPFQKRVKAAGDIPQDFPEGFFITEYVEGAPYDGSGGRPNTALQLVGDMMPMQPFPWDGEQRLVKQYYPGNPEPAVQVLGSKENEVTIKGRFKDKRYQDPAYYGVSYQFARALEEMRKRGNLIKFGMHGQAGDWVRYGWLEKTAFKMNKLSWVEYDLTFFIVSTTFPKNNYFTISEKDTPDAVNQKLINSAIADQKKYSAIPDNMPQSIGDVISGLVNDVAATITVVTNFVDSIVLAALDAQAAAFRAIGLIKNAKVTLYRYRRDVGALVGDFSNLSNQISNPAGQFSDALKNVSFLSDFSSTTGDRISDLAKMQANFEAISKTIPISRHRVIDGDTLQRIAVKFYGSADNWKNIYDHNKLQTSVLVVGSVLEIPKL